MTNRGVLILYALLLPVSSFAQPVIRGKVKSQMGDALFAANVYLKSAPQKGTTTNFDGEFEVKLTSENDTLLVSYIGYKTKRIPLRSVNLKEEIIVVLQENSRAMAKVVITAKDPVSEQFSVVKMSMLKDVYLNPVAQGDPLKAITVLPASTTINEMANPSLRGSAADRTRVVLNGVPIYKPVRANQLNNQGFFSLFNAELIDKQYVYASNPPLTYGNTSAGLVEIQTLQQLYKNQLQLSASLASLGFLVSQKIKKDVAFVQVYGNNQFSEAFVGIQKEKLPDINKFNTRDAGINFHSRIGQKAEFNSYTYFIDENFNGTNEQFTYRGEVATDKRRIFTVNNLKFFTAKGVLSINSGVNSARQHFSFGNIYSDQKTRQVFTSVNYKWFLLPNTDWQFGITHEYHSLAFNDSIPVYYYALAPDSPNEYLFSSAHNHILEMYFYSNWDINEKLTFSSGLRSNIPVENQQHHISWQTGLKYHLNSAQSLLLSGGKYHSYAVPSYFSKKYSLLASYQIALDYSFELKNTLLKAATYFKQETGEQSVDTYFFADKINTFGLELFVAYNFYKYCKLTLANSFIDQKLTIDGSDYPGPKDFHYFLKTTFHYNNPGLFSLALTYTSRPGAYYNEISGSSFDNQTGFYQPVFADELFTGQYSHYNRFDLSLSKFIRMKKNAIIAYLSVNNLFNRRNQKQVQYNADYSVKHFDYYQFRTIYFGAVWQLNY